MTRYVFKDLTVKSVYETSLPLKPLPVLDSSEAEKKNNSVIKDTGSLEIIIALEIESPLVFSFSVKTDIEAATHYRVSGAIKTGQVFDEFEETLLIKDKIISTSKIYRNLFNHPHQAIHVTLLDKNGNVILTHLHRDRHNIYSQHYWKDKVKK